MKNPCKVFYLFSLTIFSFGQLACHQPCRECFTPATSDVVTFCRTQYDNNAQYEEAYKNWELANNETCTIR